MKKKIKPEIAEKLGWDKEKIADLEKVIEDAPVVDVSDDYIDGFNAGAEFMSNAFMARYNRLRETMVEVSFELYDIAKNPVSLEK